MQQVVLILCWNEMDEHTIVIRLDNAAQSEYRVCLCGHECKTVHGGESVHFGGAEYGELCKITVETKDGDAACEPVVFHFLPSHVTKDSPKDSIPPSGVRIDETHRPQNMGRIYGKAVIKHNKHIIS